MFRSVVFVASVLATLAVVDAKPVIKTYDPNAKQPLTPLQQRYAAAPSRTVVVARAESAAPRPAATETAVLFITEPAAPRPVLRELAASEAAAITPAASRPWFAPAIVEHSKAAGSEPASIAAQPRPALATVAGGGPIEIAALSAVAEQLRQPAPVAPLPVVAPKSAAPAPSVPAAQADLATALAERAAMAASLTQIISAAYGGQVDSRVDRIEGGLGTQVTLLTWLAILQFAGLVWLARRVRRDQRTISWLAADAPR